MGQDQPKPLQVETGLVCRAIEAQDSVIFSRKSSNGIADGIQQHPSVVRTAYLSQQPPELRRKLAKDNVLLAPLVRPFRARER